MKNILCFRENLLLIAEVNKKSRVPQLSSYAITNQSVMFTLAYPCLWMFPAWNSLIPPEPPDPPDPPDPSRWCIDSSQLSRLCFHHPLLVTISSPPSQDPGLSLPLVRSYSFVGIDYPFSVLAAIFTDGGLTATHIWICKGMGLAHYFPFVMSLLDPNLWPTFDFSRCFMAENKLVLCVLVFFSQACFSSKTLAIYCVIFSRVNTSICRVCSITAICRFYRLLASISSICDVSFVLSSANFIALARYSTALCSVRYIVTMTDHEFSLKESSIFPSSSLVFRECGIGNTTSKMFPLRMETTRSKAAFIAASTIEIRHLNVFMDSLSLVKFLKCRDFVNEPESILHGIRCLLGSFSTIFNVYVLCTAIVLAESLSLFSLLNICSITGV